jgi:hypothetical protein
MRNISTAVRGHYDDDRYMWAIIIRRFCDMKMRVWESEGVWECSWWLNPRNGDRFCWQGARGAEMWTTHFCACTDLAIFQTDTRLSARDHRVCENCYVCSHVLVNCPGVHWSVCGNMIVAIKYSFEHGMFFKTNLVYRWCHDVDENALLTIRSWQLRFSLNVLPRGQPCSGRGRVFN